MAAKTSFLRIPTESRNALRQHCTKNPGLVMGTEAAKALAEYIEKKNRKQSPPRVKAAKKKKTTPRRKT